MWVNGYKASVWSHALGDGYGSAMLRFSWELAGSAQLLQDTGTSASYSTVVNKLDNIYEKRGIEGPTVLKIDVEGYEGRVIMGATEMIRRVSPVIFLEYNPDPQGKHRVQECFDFLRSEEYVVGHVQTSGQVAPITYEQIENVPAVDMLCFQKYQR